MTFLPRDQVDWPAVAAALGPLTVIDDPAMVRQKSRDFFWYSPILKRQMNHLSGDLLVLPTSEDEVLHAARVARQFRVPLTVRGAGTGNYGQAMPLHGG
ncbi:MAG: FAD-binding protein, partial [Ferrovibrionaceae bacterium]